MLKLTLETLQIHNKYVIGVCKVCKVIFVTIAKLKTEMIWQYKPPTPLFKLT